MKIINSILLICGLASFMIFMFLLQPQNFSGTEFDIRVINGFTNNSSLPLVIWCSSEHNDIGGRALQEKDDFSWSLRTSFWGTSNHFVCTMKWDKRRRRFDAFKVPRDVQRCGLFRKCSWLVREDGFYFSNDEVNWKKDFSW